MGDELRVAVGQAAPRSLDIAANAAIAAGLVAQAGKAGARLLLLPELFLCGYDLPALRADPGAATLRIDDARLDGLRAAAAEAGCAVVVGAALDGPGRPLNAVLVLDRRGAVVATYAKRHLWGEERRVLGGGRTDVMLELEGFRLGLAICYDAGFPEHARALARRGADAYLVAGAFAVGEEARRLAVYCPARALENTVYLLFANLVGTAGGLAFCGESAIHAPDGGRLAHAGAETGIAVALLSRAQLAATREQLPYIHDGPIDPERYEVAIA